MRKVKLTAEIFDNLSIGDIIYAEYASGGAMGNTGGLIIYTIFNNNLTQFETSIYDNQELYLKVTNILLGRCFNFPNFVEYTGPRVFDFCDGGFGNSVFLNVSYKIGRTDDTLLFIKEGEKIEIWCSVQGVFESIVKSLAEKYGKSFSSTDILDLKHFYEEKERKIIEERKERLEILESRDEHLRSDIESVLAKYGNRFNELITIINRYDPMELISIGCPSDEYSPEARTIIVQLNSKQTVIEIENIIYEEFKFWFGIDSAGNKERYRKLAKEVHHWISKGGLLKLDQK